MITLHSSVPNKPSLPPGFLARWEVWLLAAVLIVGGALRLVCPDLSYYNLHVERDLYRALQLLTGDEFPLLGSEMQYGGRVFGPLVYFLYAIPLAISTNPIGIAIFIGILNTALLVGAWVFTRYYFGPVAGAVAVLYYGFFPLEVVQLRFLWNPCFLPMMILGMYAFLFRFLMGRSGWNFVGVVLFFSLGFQLHFSVLMTIPAILFGLFAARRWPSLRVWGASVALVLVLFSPMIVYELMPGRANVKEVLAVPDAKQDPLRRHYFNPNAFRNFYHIVALDWNESGARLGFTYLYFLRNEARKALGASYPAVAAVVLVMGFLQFVLWATGVGSAAWKSFHYWRSRSSLGGEERAEQWRTVFPLTLVLIWNFCPLLFLTFFNYHRQEGIPALIPIRYYLIAFPAQFILAGVGLSVVLGVLKGRGSRAVLLGLLAVQIAVYTGVSVAHLRLMDVTKSALPYLYYRAPTLERMLDIREMLLEEFKVTAEDYYTRVTTQNVLRPYAGEASIDLLITQDPRAYDNEGLPDNTHLVIWAPLYDRPEDLPAPPEEHTVLQVPAHEDGTEQRVLREGKLGDLRFILFEGAKPEGLAFDAVDKLNFYYRTERMKNLRGEAER